LARDQADHAVQRLGEETAAIEQQMATVMEGKPEVVRLLLVSLLAGGHVLLEDVPGVGKTLLTKALGRSLECTVKRVQFTPDLLPTDITGVTVYQQESGRFTFRPGAVFANVVLGDEINRAGPKTQSALLEAMEEQQVTIDGVTHALPSPFLVIATQNPIELEGTYPLPEAQRDRFLMRLSIGYPSADAELEVLEVHGEGDRLAELSPVTDASSINWLKEVVGQLHAAPALRRYIVDVVRATREHPAVELGASPRASLALLRAARALAAIAGRDFVIPDDVKHLTPYVLAHRLVLTPQARMGDATPADVLAEVLASVPVPTSDRGPQAGAPRRQAASLR
jgi:MoxR-like ATPase